MQYNFFYETRKFSKRPVVITAATLNLLLYIYTFITFIHSKLELKIKHFNVERKSIRDNLHCIYM